MFKAVTKNGQNKVNAVKNKIDLLGYELTIYISEANKQSGGSDIIKRIINFKLVDMLRYYRSLINLHHFETEATDLSSTFNN